MHVESEYQEGAMLNQQTQEVQYSNAGLRLFSQKRTDLNRQKRFPATKNGM